MKKIISKIFIGLVFATLLTPVWVFVELQFPFITGKAFFFRIAVELALPFFVYLLIVEKSLRPRIKNPLNITLLIFLVINIVTALTGVNPGRSLWGNFERMGGVYYLAHLVFLYFYVQMLGQISGVYLKRFLQAFIAVAVFLSLNGISGLLNGPVIIPDTWLPSRISSTFGNPIFFASYLIIPLFLSIYFILSEEGRREKILYSLAALVQLVGVYYSGTRGALVGIVAGLFVGGLLYTFFNQNKKIRKNGLMALGVIVLLSGLLFVYRNSMPQLGRVSRVLNFSDSNSAARLIQWKMAWEGFKQKPVLGMGAENYYFIANKNYDPKIVQYDRSWFDKPHNFLLEVLTTNGIFGLLAYVFAFGFAVYGLWFAQKAQLLSLQESALLIAGVIAYQVQNLFVFDTVSASIAYFVFLGFINYTYEQSRQEEIGSKKKEGSRGVVGEIVFAICFIGVFYLVYASNVTSIQAARRVNFGTSFTNQNAEASAKYFESALDLPFNLDPREVANRYSEYAVNISKEAGVSLDPEFVKQQLEKATNYQRKIAEKTQNDPILWMRLAIDELSSAMLNNQSFQASKADAQKAYLISPQRTDLIQLKLEIAGREKSWPEAIEYARQIVELNPYDPGLKWQLAMLYFLNAETEKGVEVGEQAEKEGYKFTKLQEFTWYIQYFQSHKNYNKLVALFERAVELEPNELGLYVELAKNYALVGNYERARVMANQIIAIDPSQKTTMENFLKNLK